MKQLQQIKGIGPKTYEKLNNQNIKTIEDLLFCFPVKYIKNYLNKESDIELNKELELKVFVYQKPKIFFIRKNLDKLSLKVRLNNFIFNVSIFNRRFLFKSLLLNTEIVIIGRFINNLNNFTASNIILYKNFKVGVFPVYNIKDINDSLIYKAINNIMNESIEIKESLPEYILKRRNIPKINESIYKIHKPDSEKDIEIARRRIVYEELLSFALRIETLKELNKSIITKSKDYDLSKVKEFISSLPFELTFDQKQATNDIFRDLKNKKQMNRLLQGDVGSGKTIISVIASLAVVTSGFQVAIMVPTLVLAKQHYVLFRQYLLDYGVSIGLLISEMKSKQRNEMLNLIKKNKIDIVIGTHSLIQEQVDFYNLGFLVIDEQHRFGVKQRRELRLKGVTPDILLMSATPIPRTLAIAIYNDIDISFIKQKPLGRIEIITEIVAYENIDYVLEQMIKELDKNHQAYVICSKIEESEKTKRLSVEEVNLILKEKLSNRYSIELLHGKLSDQEKTNIINKFYKNEINILISTTVVEVGINVKNATIMLIMNADSFGLAQLHQLRGRIGRDKFQAYCYLIVDDISKASERLKIMKETTDGFLISEYDLSMRGSGEVFGSLQSGIPIFKMANIISDEEILNQALEDAKIILQEKDKLSTRLKNITLKTIESYNLD